MFLRSSSFGILFTLAFLSACSSRSTEVPDVVVEAIETAPIEEVEEICPESEESEGFLPNVTAEQRTLSYWLERNAENHNLDEVLITSAESIAHSEAIYANSPTEGYDLYDLSIPLEEEAVREDVIERLRFMRSQFEEGRYLTREGERLPNDRLARYSSSSVFAFSPSFHRVVENTPIRCGPDPGSYFTASLDLRFDRNNCSSLHAGELIQVLSEWPNDMLLVRSSYTLGWIDSASTFSEEIAPSSGDFRPIPRELTRRELFSEAFSYLNEPYGWGGQNGGRDCSRFIMDLFSSFGIALPRHSSNQARAGTFSIDVESVESETERMLLIEAAAERGIVLLHFPGHIMLYLGQDENSRPMVLHSFAEYVAPCEEVDPRAPESVETLLRVDQIDISDLELGRGSSRRSFIERLTKITVIGRAPGYELMGITSLRAPMPVEIPESCNDDGDMHIFFSPRTPNVDQPLRVIVTGNEDPGPTELVVQSPSGERITLEARRYGAPPYSFVGSISAPEVGLWTAVLGEGSNIDACARINVRSQAPTSLENHGDGVWSPRNVWTNNFNNFYALWVEALFDYPLDEDITWTNLHEILQDSERNILYNHYSQNDDARLSLRPDCADLPYLLRAYFAWKVGLPFAYRRCGRGRAGRPPECRTQYSNLITRNSTDDIDAFQWFAHREVRNTVHSGSGRTAPNDSITDWYPIPLTREAILPGTMYADPYGHLLTVVRWVPQGLNDYGVLVAVDAQPDATIGRRRFWRGSFLFTSETTDVGAGFKAYRPSHYDRETGAITQFTNEEIMASSNAISWSDQQYTGSIDDFYEAIEGLTNPRPLDPIAMQISLVDALEESVSRRVNSVNNGEGYMRSHNYAEIRMPEGYDIFETSGPWEDFSTPSRDMRLLISIDTVVNFVDNVRRNPDRFGLNTASVEAAIVEIEAARTTSLQERSFEYTRSDGSVWPLTLLDVVERAVSFEMSYNPNDCSEIRWSAPAESDEFASCQRHAPSWQRDRMDSYRSWFEDRQRPPR